MGDHLDTGKLLEVRNLKVWFPIRRLFREPLFVRAVDNVSFDLHRGETLAVVGESGCGKTTLGKTCLRLIEPTSGSIVYDGRDITMASNKDLRWYRREAQIIYQDPFSSLNPFFTVYKTLEEPLIVNEIEDDRSELIYKALEDVKLTPIEEFVSKYPHMLSGGQRQRVAIARALILKPRFVVADEPVSMLDVSVRVEILYLLKELQERYGISFLYITHDIATVKYFSDRIGIMYAGNFVESGSIRKVVSDPLHPYTKALIEAIPDPDPKNRFVERKVIPGEPPNPIDIPPGCRFHPRCLYAMPVCREEEPIIRGVEKDRYVACWLYGE
ncbi:MAG: ABC transporter ATP-binding protein [Candidatus Bathyarchaeota archaeon]|nr:ABC transporter ATP-binding protein [Candidatus Bathyarchaeota archaeon]